MGLKKQLVLASMLCVTARASDLSVLYDDDFAHRVNAAAAQGTYLSISLDDQTAAPTKRVCQVSVELSSDSATAQESFMLTRQDDLRTFEMGRFNKIDVTGYIQSSQHACPDPRGASLQPAFSGSHTMDDQVYSLKIVLSNSPQNLNVTQVQFLERRYDYTAEDF